MHIETRKSPPTAESRNAALLLLKFKSLAEHELKANATPTKRTVARLTPQESFASFEEISDSDEEEESIAGTPPLAPRSRTVSLCSQDAPGHSSPLALCSPSPPNSPSQGRPTKDASSLGATAKADGEIIFAKPPSSKLVGTTARSPLKGVLKRKFAWKAFPLLEGYLVQHREEYLQFSSQLNYTAEQKHYNNKLTQGLLDLASEEGYTFENFTFAAIRDRIRCYYKSFVQAVKKKKRKKRA